MYIYIYIYSIVLITTKSIMTAIIINNNYKTNLIDDNYMRLCNVMQ